MSGAVINMVGKRMVKKQLKGHFDSEALYFHPGEKKKLGRKNMKIPFPQPEGITAEEAAFLQQCKKRAYQLDASFGSILGTKLGITSIIGLIPVIGDFADTGLALLMLREIRKIQPPLSPQQQMTMLIRIALQFAIGSVPILGDYIDGVYKANSRNVAALERELMRRAAKRANTSGYRLDDEADARPYGNRTDYYDQAAQPYGHRTDYYDQAAQPYGPPAYNNGDRPAQNASLRDRRQAPPDTTANNPRSRWFDWRANDADLDDEPAPALPPRKQQPEMQQAWRQY